MMKKIPIILFGLSICFLVFNLGIVVAKYELFPYPQIKTAIGVAKEFRGKVVGKSAWYYPKTNFTKKLNVYNEKEADSALVLFSSMSEKNGISAKVIDKDGELIHEWRVDWFDVWPDPKHLTKKEIPKVKPGTNIHGILVLENGDLLFNFGGKSLVRMNVCGDVIWKIPYRTHHSIWRDDNDILWVPGSLAPNDALVNYPNFKQPIQLHTILKVSMDGQILDEISLTDLLVKNNLQGLLYMSDISSGGPYIEVSGDIFHVNDVEVFPASKEEGIFKAGDIMVSIRNMNAIIVFNGTDYSVRYLNVGAAVRQHDPDFVDGNTISIFDNHPVLHVDQENHSRITILSAKNNTLDVFYRGDDENPFFTDGYGNHEWLPNGNLLLVDSYKGRIFEVDSTGKIVWEYINIVKEGNVGIVQEAKRLPEHFSKSFFEQRVMECQNSK